MRCCDNQTIEECCGFPQTDVVCQDGTVRCNDGECRQESECVNGVNCPPDYPYRCNNQCVSDPLQCLKKPTCDDGWVRCGNGMCSPTYNECKLIGLRSDFCPFDKPILCADSSCANTLEEVITLSIVLSVQCPTVTPCPETNPYRCDDNRCVVDEFQCSSRETCPEGSTRCKYGRNSGMCISTDDPVLTCEDSSICDVTKPVLYELHSRFSCRCPNGECATSIIECSLRKSICSEGNSS